MKKILLLLTTILIFSLTGCDELDEILDDDDSQVVEVNKTVGDEADNEMKLSFETKTISGESVSLDDFSDKQLIMINFFEPWCGPCVKEMPELEEVYQTYKDEGFIIVGAFSTPNQEDEILKIIDATGVTYPIVYATDSMTPYMTDYVPTTVFIDGEGNVISEEPIIGSGDFDKWSEVVESLLGQ